METWHAGPADTFERLAPKTHRKIHDCIDNASDNFSVHEKELVYGKDCCHYLTDMLASKKEAALNLRKQEAGILREIGKMYERSGEILKARQKVSEADGVEVLAPNDNFVLKDKLEIWRLDNLKREPAAYALKLFGQMMKYVTEIGAREKTMGMHRREKEEVQKKLQGGESSRSS